MNGKRAIAFAQLQNKMNDIARQAETDRINAVQATDTIDNALTTMMDNFAMNTQKASKTWQDFVKQLTSGLTTIAAKQAGQQLFGKRVRRLAGSISSITSKIFGGAAGAGGGAQATAEAANTASLDVLNVTMDALNLALAAILRRSGLGPQRARSALRRGAAYKSF